MTTLYVGLDIGSSTCHQVVMQADGQISINRRFSTSEAHLIDAFTSIGGQLHVHLEADELAPWVRSVIAPLAKRVLIFYPATNTWIHKDPNKRDQIDATKLADLATHESCPRGLLCRRAIPARLQTARPTL
jgi:hypothetical protein